MKTWIRGGALALASLLAMSALPQAAAHCDTMNGPVVRDAQQALAKRDVTPVLKWLRAEDEPAIRAAFEKSLAVRAHSKEAAELADAYFFETLVRLHRAGEGEPYTGLKTAPVDPAIAAADAALASADASKLGSEMSAKLREALQQRFDKVVALRRRADSSVEAGREYVAAYVAFMHFAEQVSGLLEAPTAAHVH